MHKTSKSCSFIAMAVSAILLTACVSPAEMAAADRRTCTGYGFAEGTDAFSNCMMQADMRRKDQNAAWQRQQQEQRTQQSRIEMDRRSSESTHWTTENCNSSGTSVTVGGVTSSSSSSHCSGR